MLVSLLYTGSKVRSTRNPSCRNQCFIRLAGNSRSEYPAGSRASEKASACGHSGGI